VVLKKSQQIFAQALNYMPGGVNSPVRAFKSVGLDPVVIKSAKGSKIYDVDGNEYIDYVCSWGPLILGHAHPEVIDFICKSALNGTSYGATCEMEIELARMICEAIPSIEKIRMVNSGTEAAMSAVRLARAYTRRDKIVKFEGCYHGHGDMFLIKAGSGMLTGGIPTSPGIPETTAEQTIVAQYNDIESVNKLFNKRGSDIACVIVEPVAGNMGLIPPEKGFLEGLRQITESNGSLLIFDEVITGFRLTYGGYQNIAGIKPDLTTLGKIIGGGLPVGAYGGRKDIMERVSPEGDVYQAGTLSGNPLAMAAGIKTLSILKKSDCYERLDKMGSLLVEQIMDILKKKKLGYSVNRMGSMFTLMFSEKEVVDFKTVMTCDTDTFSRFYRNLFKDGIYFPPSQYETCFLSCAHTPDDINKTAEAINNALDSIL
jgi:glutamate-1-semialdehyde 2,1-aminomutase